MQLNSVSLKGSFHQAQGLPNQDFVQIYQSDGFTGAVICDGVSLQSDLSFSKSEIASKLCTKTAAAYLEEHLERNLTDEQILSILSKAFIAANDQLVQTLRKLEIKMTDCQTTMIAFAYRKGRVFAGIAGDGGILYKMADGSLGAMVTDWKASSQVYPISVSSKWRFFSAGSKTDPVRQVLAATDGVFDCLAGLQNGQIAVNYQQIDKICAVSSAPVRKRTEQLARLIQHLPSSDDCTAVLMTDGKIKRM